MRNKQTYLNKISVKSDSFNSNAHSAIKNFESFYQKPIDELTFKDEDELFDILQGWINYAYEYELWPSSIKLYFNHLKNLLYHKGIKITPQDVRQNLSFPKLIKEELYPVKLDEIHQILRVAPYQKQGIYVAMISSGMSIGEITQIRKKDIDLSMARPKIIVPGMIRKVKRGKTTFISLEAFNYIKTKFPKLDDNDRVWSDIDPHSEIAMFSRYVDQAGLGFRYDSGRRKITSHSLRAYFITKLSRYDPNLAKELAGQKGYLLQYDRLDDEEKLRIYMELEPELLIHDNTKLKLENSKLRSENISVSVLLTKMDEMKKRQDESDEKLKAFYESHPSHNPDRKQAEN